MNIFKHDVSAIIYILIKCDIIMLKKFKEDYIII